MLKMRHDRSNTIRFANTVWVLSQPLPSLGYGEADFTASSMAKELNAETQNYLPFSKGYDAIQEALQLPKPDVTSNYTVHFKKPIVRDIWDCAYSIPKLATEASRIFVPIWNKLQKKSKFTEAEHDELVKKIKLGLDKLYFLRDKYQTALIAGDSLFWKSKQDGVIQTGMRLTDTVEGKQSRIFNRNPKFINSWLKTWRGILGAFRPEKE